MNKIILLDRDGVINQDRPDYIQTTEQLILIPGSAAAIGRLSRAGYKVLIITNQACIGKGLVSIATLTAIHQLISQAVEKEGGTIDQFYFCPHHPDDGCPCRKPKPGMIINAQKDWGFDLKNTWMVGDAVRDMEAASAAGCKTAIVRTGKGEESAATLPALAAFDNLAHFVSFLLDDNPAPSETF